MTKNAMIESKHHLDCQEKIGHPKSYGVRSLDLVTACHRLVQVSGVCSRRVERKDAKSVDVER